MNTEIMDFNGMKYEYVRYNNKYSLPWQFYVDNLISYFISQDVNKDYAFVVTYQCTAVVADAIICVFQPGRNKLIPFGCVKATAKADLFSLRPQCASAEEVEQELTPTQVLRYFAEGYVDEGYVENHNA